MFEKDGQPVAVGGKSRTVPVALRRALQSRDVTCRFPGCDRAVYVDAHHIKHWIRGGPMTLANLVLLCRFHHRAVHKGGFDVFRDATGKLVFTRASGEAIPSWTPAVRAEQDLSPFIASAGLRVVPDAAGSLWDGSGMDLDLCVQVLCQDDGLLGRRWRKDPLEEAQAG